MPKQITQLRVFVASPGDVEPERSALENVINDLNIFLGKTREIQLDLIRWETHAYPNLGDDVQSIINQQIGDDYDIFIGILWTRFGTPTPRAMSGTAEEFEHAYNRFQENSDRLRVLIYFNESPVSPSELEPEQLALIQRFRDSLGEKGALFWTYTELEEFSSLVRMHLILHITDFGKSWGTGIEAPQTEIEELPDYDVQVSDIEFEDYGFLDLIEIGTENFSASGETAEQITTLMNELTEKMTSNTDELNSLPRPVNTQHAKRIINRTADELEHFASRMQTETPRLIERYGTGVNSYGRAAELWLDFGSDDKSPIEDSLESVHNLKETLCGTQQSMSGFRDAVRNLPRITTKFNLAKRNALTVVENFIDEMTTAINLTIEVEKTMKRILEG